MSFTVAILGRPNVGKSTLFNRLVGKRLALVDDQAGVTRDRRIAPASLYDLTFNIIDTAGLEHADSNSLEARMVQQSQQALTDCDVALFMIDAREGINYLDNEFANMLRKNGKPIILIANKAEGNAQFTEEGYSLGLGEPILVSAEHAQGMREIRDAIIEALELKIDYSDEDEEEETVDPTLSIAIVGRPNAGKSTLINRIIGQDRLLTGEEAGITRDSISVDWIQDGRAVRLVDTAGMRKQARVSQKLEKLSVMDAKRTIQYAEIVVVMFDSTISFEKQDLHIVEQISKEGRAPVLVFNKWDLIKDKSAMKKELGLLTKEHLPQLRGLRTVMLSSTTGRGLDALWKEIFEVYEVWNKRISTANLNRWLEEVLEQHPPPLSSGRRMRLKYITQTKARPPTFVVQVSRDGLPESYIRYLRNSLRDTFDLQGVPIRVMMRKGKNPYVPDEPKRKISKPRVVKSKVRSHEPRAAKPQAKKKKK